MRWPAVDEIGAGAGIDALVVQVNGKVRGRISVAADAAKADIEAAASGEDNVLKHIADKPVRKSLLCPANW